MNKIYAAALTAFCFFLFPNILLAQVKINEVFPNPDDDESGKEWVELYNTSSSIVSLSGCTLYLDDLPDTSQKIVFDSEEFIDGVDKFKLYTSWSGIWLRNDGDQVRLICDSFQDIFSYGDQAGSVIEKPPEGWSVGRYPDGSNSYSKFSDPTPLENNVTPTPPPPTPTYTPTPTNTPTPSPTSTLTPTPTNTPKLTNTPVVKSTPSVKVNRTDQQVASDQRASVLGDDINQGIFGKDPSVDDYIDLPGTSTESGFGDNFPIIATLFIVFGIGFVILSGYLFVRSKKEEGKGEKNEEI